MFECQQGVTGPQAGFHPTQVSGPLAYAPLQTDWTGMFGMMMPLIMMIMMFAIITPMLKGVTAPARE